MTNAQAWVIIEKWARENNMPCSDVASHTNLSPRRPQSGKQCHNLELNFTNILSSVGADANEFAQFMPNKKNKRTADK